MTDLVLDASVALTRCFKMKRLLPPIGAPGRVLDSARQERLMAYDAAYLELAMRGSACRSPRRIPICAMLPTASA